MIDFLALVSLYLFYGVLCWLSRVDGRTLKKLIGDLALWPWIF